jgi:hypothetical protein
LGVILVVMAVAYIAILGYIFQDDLCSDEIVQEDISSEGVPATYYIRNCGATTTYTFVVRLGGHREGGHKIDKNDVFVSTYDGGIELEWLDSETLVIRDTELTDSKIFKQELQWKDVNIVYEYPEDME